MSNAEYLRRQAENCIRIARTCFDLASAERMRLLAAELKSKAAELEKQDAMTVPMFERNSPFTGKTRRD